MWLLRCKRVWNRMICGGFSKLSMTCGEPTQLLATLPQCRQPLAHGELPPRLIYDRMPISGRFKSHRSDRVVCMIFFPLTSSPHLHLSLRRVAGPSMHGPNPRPIVKSIYQPFGATTTTRRTPMINDPPVEIINQYVK